MTGIGPSPGGAQLVHSRLSLTGGNRRSIGSSGLAATPAIQNKGDESASAYLALQDDEEERRQRQLSRLQQLQQSRTHGSPGADGTPSGKDKRRSVSSLEPRLTGQQLALHYTKCIQLSAENKINIKNAFNLQLIDFMTDMLKKKHSDMNNFQVASCTLDASTKIYAYRVDSVHTDTMRMAGGLGRTQHDAGHAPEDVDGDQPGEQIGKIKRKRTKKAATIESNPAALNLSSLDLEFIVDPLFKKIASEFDEGKAGGGLFLNALMLRMAGCVRVASLLLVLLCACCATALECYQCSGCEEGQLGHPIHCTQSQNACSHEARVINCCSTNYCNGASLASPATLALLLAPLVASVLMR
ncbi:condensin complex subunit 2-like [Hyalella azteca]|uniref:Condensin complex subunit 2 n=1 Tax=Hyalella azteca TaxID=294128 RepID=A0A8B7N4H8_HYAAZ|nr:condensin complex subunit 2-like [Hyalella azteca]